MSSTPPEIIRKKSRTKPSNGRPWTANQVQDMLWLQAKKVPISSIAVIVNHPVSAVYAKLSELGKSPNTPDPKLKRMPERSVSLPPLDGRSIVDDAKDTLRRAGWSDARIRVSSLDQIMLASNTIKKRQGQEVRGRKPEWIPVDDKPKV